MSNFIYQTYNNIYNIGKTIYDIISPLIPLNTVENIDIDKYLGKWVEYRRKPNFFQNNSKSFATYTKIDEKIIEVYNQQITTNGIINDIKGIAVITDNPGKLLVSFNNIFYAPYWIIGLIENDEKTRYDVSIVSDPFRTTFWILTRENTDINKYKNKINEILLDKYFNFKNLLQF